ncbi:hypothetical protein DWF04_005680 [Cereibacter sphaeroides f. sp. denitrificans]
MPPVVTRSFSAPRAVSNSASTSGSASEASVRRSASSGCPVMVDPSFGMA